MGKNTSIAWTDHTFSPWWGCLEVSDACTFCYARVFAKRVGHAVWGPPRTTERRMFGPKHWAEPLKWNAEAQAEGRRHRVFSASMADVFEYYPELDAERARLWRLIEATPWLDWQLLTKRPQLIMRMVPESWRAGFPPNVWIGTTVEDQGAASLRIPVLLKVPAVVRFLSCEPLLGLVGLWGPIYRLPDGAMGSAFAWGTGVNWVITGGESGAGARPMEATWVRTLITQCDMAGVPIFHKQMGTVWAREHKLKGLHGDDPATWPAWMRRQEFPTPQQVAV